jgi:hypothetical protein
VHCSRHERACAWSGFGVCFAARNSVSRVRFSEFVPPLPLAEAQRLRGLSAAGHRSVEESQIDGVTRRAKGMAALLEARGRRHDAGELRRRVDCLERLDEWHRHASDLEIVAGLYRAMRVFASEPGPGPEAEEDAVWIQTCPLGADADAPCHGPAFRETADLRGRALRWVLSALASYEREPASSRARVFDPRRPRSPSGNG